MPDDKAIEVLHPIEAEQSVLGALLLVNEEFTKVSDLTAADFCTDSHREIYNAISGLQEREIPADVVTVSDALESAGRLDARGGLSYPGALVKNVPAAATMVHYAKIVTDKARVPRLREVGGQLASAATVPGATADDLLVGIQSKLEKIGHHHGDAMPFEWANAMDDDDGEEEFVEGTITRGTMCVLYGESNSGKT